MNQIILTLIAAIEAAPEAEKQNLARAIEEYAEKFPRSFRNMRDGSGGRFAKEFLDEVCPTIDARPNYPHNN